MKNKSNLNLQFNKMITIVGSLMALVLLLVGCGGSSTVGAQATIDARVQLSWFHNIEFIGFYEAERSGEYTNVGLNVKLNQGGFDAESKYIDPVEQVSSGVADFGVTGAPTLLRAREDGKPLVAIAAIYQRSPVVLFSLSDKNINRPADLIGKRIGTQPATSTVGITFSAFLKSQKIEASTFTPVTDIQFGSADALFNDEVDVMQGYITNQVMQARLRSDDVNVMLVSDYGIDFYSNVIFTTEDMIANHPDVVEGFVRATVNGMNQAIENPVESATAALEKYILANSPDKSAQETQLRGMQASLPLINPVGSKPGLMNVEVWNYTQSVLMEQGLLDAEQNVSQAFTLEFLNKVYGS